MKYNNFRRRAVEIAVGNEILDLLRKAGVKIIYVGRYECLDYIKENITDFNYSTYAIVKELDTCIWIETKYFEPKKRATRYVVNLNGEKKATISGLQCFFELQRYCFKANKAAEYNWAELDKWWDKTQRKYQCSAKPIIGFNPQYQNQELHKVYEYDINSAYSSVMLDKIPDVNKPYFNVKLKDNQVGFLLDEDLTLISRKNCIVDIAFDLIELTADQKKYIMKLYNAKALAEDEYDHDTIKLKLNASIGYYQKWNPFLRSYIVNKCNERIKALLDADSVLWNTDAIFSLKQRPELPKSALIGEFKEIEIDRFIYVGNNYQINYDLPKYRGISKAWFKNKTFDLLKDKIPERCNKYVYDKTTAKIIKNKEY